MNKLAKTIIFVSIICVMIAFLAGMRYGKFVQKLDNSYVPPSPTPIIVVSPTEAPQELTFSTFSNKTCRVSFVYPSYFVADVSGKGSSSSAELINKNESIFVSCEPKDITTFKQDFKENIASKEAQLGTARGVSYNVDAVHIAYLIRNPLIAKDIVIRIPRALETLVQSTFKLSEK